MSVNAPRRQKWQRQALVALEAACRGKDSVIIRRRLEKLLPNPEIDTSIVTRASVRNSRTLLRFFFSSMKEGEGLSSWKKISIYVTKAQHFFIYHRVNTQKS